MRDCTRRRWHPPPKLPSNSLLDAGRTLPHDHITTPGGDCKPLMMPPGVCGGAVDALRMGWLFLKSAARSLAPPSSSAGTGGAIRHTRYGSHTPWACDVYRGALPKIFRKNSEKKKIYKIYQMVKNFEAGRRDNEQRERSRGYGHRIVCHVWLGLPRTGSAPPNRSRQHNPGITRAAAAPP